MFKNTTKVRVFLLSPDLMVKVSPKLECSVNILNPGNCQDGKRGRANKFWLRTCGIYPEIHDPLI